MNAQPSPLSSEMQPQINMGRVEFINVYQVKENELETLEKGSEANIDLSFAIFLYSSAFTSIAALVTSGFKSEKVALVFIVFTIGAVIAGSYFTFRWWRSRGSIKTVISTIKNRIPPSTTRTTEVSELRQAIEIIRYVLEQRGADNPQEVSETDK